MAAPMDDLDREILDHIQWTFPLVARPYDEIAAKFAITPDEAKARISHLKELGVLRQLSAIFDTRRLGYKSSLVAMEIEPDRLVEVAEHINLHPGVSHNYERDHKFNLWFTLAVPPGADLKTEVDKFQELPGIISVRMLPTIQLFKIGVKLEMSAKREVKPSEKKKEVKNIKFEPTEEDKEFIRQLQKDLKVTDRPFLPAAEALNMTEEEVFERLKYYESIGVMRRYAAILRHRDAGFSANGMIVWKVPEDRIDEVGATLGAFPQVSHCYQRPVYPDWPYNVFSMVHCKSQDEAKDVARAIQGQIDVNEYKILFSTREFKKTRVEYFVEHKFVVGQAPAT
ncbi:transcriptional regulator [Cenarchaeum symbiosum A]|uniref:siroheme decarboxylase n=1 Tax=Cenarchaeum symbiosum (strain A) TaxID=414004 RepID=A0RX57_CENSY|nr:transcriptional regulator [Cenarchaeum symbiosum A]